MRMPGRARDSQFDTTVGRVAVRRDAEVRKLLRLLRRPQLLEKERLAILLRHALHAETGRAALLTVIEQTFGSSYEDTRLREIIQRCDVHGEKARLAASAMNLSLRQFFRHRVDAIAAVASTIAAQLDGVRSCNYDLALAQMISTVDMDAALGVYLSVLSTEPDVPLGAREEIARCVAWSENDWRAPARGQGEDARVAALILAERAGVALLSDHHAARALIAQARSAMTESQGALQEHAAFVLTDYELLLARVEGDLARAGSLVAQLRPLAGKNEAQHALALAEQAHQALLEGGLVRAVGLLQDAERLATENAAVRVCSRIALVKAAALYLNGNHEDAYTYARAATAALAGAQPAYAMQAAALSGRAALASGKPWDFPRRLAERFPEASLQADLETVQARHLLQIDLNSARRIASLALDRAQKHGARGAIALARATLSAIADAQHRTAEARALRSLAWQEAVSIGDHVLLYDIFAESLTLTKQLTPITA